MYQIRLFLITLQYGFSYVVNVISQYNLNLFFIFFYLCVTMHAYPTLLFFDN